MIQIISISIVSIVFYFVAITMSAMLEFLGNAEAIKLSNTNLSEAIEKYFHYSTNSYLFGIFCVGIGINMFYIMKKTN